MLRTGLFAFAAFLALGTIGCRGGVYVQEHHDHRPVRVYRPHRPHPVVHVVERRNDHHHVPHRDHQGRHVERHAQHHNGRGDHDRLGAGGGRAHDERVSVRTRSGGGTRVRARGGSDAVDLRVRLDD